MFKKLAVVALAGTMLAGCQTGGLSNTAGGAVLGGLGGAALGTLAGGDDRRNALIGAGIGALAGAAVGNYLDQQQAALQQDLQGTGAAVERQGDRLLVTLPSNVTFDVDSAQIKPQFYGPLNQVASTLQQYQQSYVNVYGHTDSTGPTAYNQQLSEQRAQAVANYLISRGVNPVRVVARGFGETQPIADNSTAFGREQNRRVELEIVPLQ
jgi:outer membrane protein OmpA-like peptidoglycan-associated protein